MTDSSPEELRVRVTVDSDTPDLLKRLAGSKRQAREIVYLLRLGMQMEMMMHGKVPMIAVATEGGAPIATQATSPVEVVPTPVISAQVSADIHLGKRLSDLTGLDATYFDGPGG